MVMLKVLKKKLKNLAYFKSWFWPLLIGGLAFAGFAVMYGFSNFISADQAGIDYTFEKAFKTIAVAGLVWVLIRMYAILGNALYKKRLGTPMPRFMQSVFNWGVILTAVMFVIVVIFEKPAWSIIAAGGFIGAGLALALQGLIQDIFSGVVLDVENNFKAEDWIRLPNNQVGRVIKSSWRSLTVQTPEGNIQVIPNGKLTAEGYQNLSRPLQGYFDSVEVSIDHNVPIARAERLLHAAILTVPEVAQDKLTEAYAFKTSEGGVSYKLRYHVLDFPRAREIRHKVLESATRHLHQAGFKISETIGEYALSRGQNDLILREELTAMDVLPKLELFKNLTEKERDQLASKIKRLEISKGDVVFKQGSAGSSMFIVGEGSVEIVKESKVKGKVKRDTLAHLGAGAFFGDMALLLGEKRTATVQAKTSVILFEVPKAALAPLLKTRPAIAKSLSEVVAKRQKETAQKMAESNQKSAREALTSSQLLKGIKKFFGV